MKKKLIGTICAGLLFVPCIGFAGCNHEHKYATTWTNDATHHWHACETCNQADEKKEHNWDEGTVTVQPTWTTDGSEVFVCQDCDMSKTETITKESSIVSAEEWETALNLREIAVYQINTSGTAEFPDIIKKDGNILYYKTDTREVYIELIDDNYYEYTKVSENEWVKDDSPYYSFDNVAAYNTFDPFVNKYEEFTYDEAKQEYVIAASDGSMQMTYRLTFNMGKLVKLIGEVVNNSVLLQSAEMIVTYDNVSLTLPTV